MNNENNIKYLKNMNNRERNFCHWRLALGQMSQYPLLFILMLPIIVLTFFGWSKMGFVTAILDVPKIILPVYTILLRVVGVLIPLVLVWGVIDAIGTLTARKDEVAIQMAFKKDELENGSPILMYKREDKKTGVTVREWYSHIPMKVWVKRQEEIADELSVHFVEKFKYGGKSNGNRIVMYSAEGREVLEKDSPVYDKQLEKDMETID